MIADKVPQDFLKTRIQEPDMIIKDLPKELQSSHERNIDALVKRLKSREPEKSSQPEKSPR